MKLCPSNSTAEAFPNDESCKLPEIMSILSCSMMLLAECVSWRGTMVSWVTFVTSAKLESSVDQVWPFQKDMNELVPSDDLYRNKYVNGQYKDTRHHTYRPAAKILLALPLLTSTAVTGPESELLSPTAAQLVFENVY